MKQLLLLLIALSVPGCNKSNEPGINLKLAGTNWVAKYSTDPKTGEILYNRYRFTTETDVVDEYYYQVSKIINSNDLTYKYDPPKLLLRYSQLNNEVEVVGNKFKRGQIEYIRE